MGKKQKSPVLIRGRHFRKEVISAYIDYFFIFDLFFFFMLSALFMLSIGLMWLVSAILFIESAMLLSILLLSTLILLVESLLVELLESLLHAERKPAIAKRAKNFFIYCFF